VAVTLLGTATTATAAEDEVSAACPVKLKWYNDQWSGCYRAGSHGIDNRVVKAVKVSQHHEATVYWRADSPVHTYGPGTHDTSRIRNNVIQVDVR
jgi:hypothetical protein